MIRLLSALSGLLLVALAFLAATQVADTRQGLIAEVVTLFGGLAGVGLLLYGLVPKRRGAPVKRSAAAPVADTPAGPRSANDLVVGGGGIAVALILLGGLAYSGGWLWAALGCVLLIPMIAGCAYLVISFARAPDRDWRVDLIRFFRSRPRA